MLICFTISALNCNHSQDWESTFIMMRNSLSVLSKLSLHIWERSKTKYRIWGSKCLWFYYCHTLSRTDCKTVLPPWETGSDCMKIYKIKWYLHFRQKWDWDIESLYHFMQNDSTTGSNRLLGLFYGPQVKRDSSLDETFHILYP